MPSDSGERRSVRPPQIPPAEQEQLRCPRCDSTNTKFCYYNNYNLSQPRHFCKACRRYWTKGGALRNIPVGGGSRKNAKRPRNSTQATTTSSSSSDNSTTPQISTTENEISAAGNELEMTGSFSTLLGTSAPGFLAVGEPFLNRGNGFGFGLGLGPVTRLDEMDFGLGRNIWPLTEVGENGGNTWQVGSGDALVDGGDCFAWPDLAISTAGKGLQ